MSLMALDRAVLAPALKLTSQCPRQRPCGLQPREHVCFPGRAYMTHVCAFSLHTSAGHRPLPSAMMASDPRQLWPREPRHRNVTL